MARGQSPLARAQARALRAFGADTPSPAASPETSVSVMAPPSTSTGAGEDSSSRPSLAGAAEVSAPSSPLTASTGDASGVSSESSSTRPGDALGSVLGAAPRSAADASEAASGAGSADSQPQGSVSNSGASGDGARSAAHVPEASSAALGASRFSSVRWEDIEDIVTTGTDRTVRQVQESTQSHFLALVRLVVDLNRRSPLRADYELDQRLEAAGSLSDVVEALAPIPRSPAPWEYGLTEFRDDVASLEARLAASEASLRRELVATNIALEQSSQAAAALEQRCRRLDKSLADTHKVIRHDREQFKAGISSYAAQLRQLRAYLEQSDRQSSASGGASSASASAMPAAFATFLEELGALQLAIPPPPAASVSSEGSGPTPPASSGSFGGAAGQEGSESSAKLQSAPPTPKKRQRLGRPSVDLKARKAAKQAASAVVSSSGPPQSVPSSLSAASLPTPSAPISGIAVSVDSDVLSFAFIPSGSDPPFSPIPRTPAPPASSTASTASLPSTPVVSSGIAPGTEASVPVEIDDDGGLGADGAASDASVPPGGVFSSPVVSQPRRDGRPTHAASTTAGLRSMVAAENEAAPDGLVLGLATPLRMPAATQASVASPASVPDPAESAAVVAAASAAVVTSSSARRRVANTHTGGHSDASASFDFAHPDNGNSHPVHDARNSVYGFRACDCYSGSNPSPAASGSITPMAETSSPLAGVSLHLRAEDVMPDKPISIRVSGLAIVVKLWRQFTGRAVGRTEHSDLGFALWERAHWISVAAVEQWLQQLSDRIGSDTPEYLETEAAWRAYNKARNLRADRLRLQVPKRFWVWCTPDASGEVKCPAEILLEPSMLQYSFETLTWAPSTAAWTAEVADLDARQPWRNCWVGLPAEHPFNTTLAPSNPSVPLFVPEGSTREEVGAAIVVNPALRQSHVTAPWVQEFSDARAQAAADASAAGDSPSDASSARTPIPTADQADVQVELGATAPAQARLDDLADLATTAEI
ncbi:unnamed protein product [Phytophthora fragariaefolia]|uniref:Unnamed protein product n=1 Tax=Phytophthora fragariaefolia TaxID=1490495 RepID=A0A9W6XLE5_9STRA|nr:unnamed protein product [Phytophthora fragariaefolia]